MKIMVNWRPLEDNREGGYGLPTLLYHEKEELVGRRLDVFVNQVNVRKDLGRASP